MEVTQGRYLRLWQVAPETARSRSKGRAAAAVLVMATTLPMGSAWATCAWSGDVNNDWFEPGNWYPYSGTGCDPDSGLPTSLDYTYLSTLGMQVVIDAGDAESGRFDANNTHLTIQNGGTLTSYSTRHDVGGWSGDPAEMLITGADSAWNVDIHNPGGAVRIGRQSHGTLILADGGALNINGSGSRVILGEYVHHPPSLGVLVIGAHVDEDAVAPGFLNAVELEMGRGDDGSGTQASGLIIFNHTDNTGGYTFSPNITGNGYIEHHDGTTVLTGTNSHSGGILLEGGTLRAGGANAFVDDTEYAINGGTLDLNGFDLTMSSLSGAGGTVALGAGHLTLDQDNSATFAGAFAGTGTLIQQGDATLNLTGDSSGFAGQTQVQAGTLLVNGTLGGAVIVENGAVLGGSGAVSSLQLNDGAVISPGNSIGSLSVDGDLSFSSGASYAVEVDPDTGDNDHILVSGTASLNGASVQHIGEHGNYQPFSRYTILSAGDGIDGEFGSVSSSFAFLTPILSYDPNQVYLELIRNQMSFAGQAITDNQRAVAAGIETLNPSHGVYRRVVALEAEQAAPTFEQLSGDSLLAGLTIGRELQQHFSAELRRQSSPMGALSATAYPGGGRADVNGLSTWVQAESLRVDEHEQADTGNAAYRGQASQLAAGVDRVWDQGWQVGVALGAAEADLTYSNRQAEGDVTSIFLGTYASWHSRGPLYLRGDLSLARHKVDHWRQVEGEALTAETQVTGARLALETGLDIHWAGLDLRPYTQVAGERLSRSGFSESGAGDARLTVERSRIESGEIKLGTDISRTYLPGGYRTRIEGGLSAVRGFGDTQARQNARFGSGGDAFAVASADLDSIQVEAALNAELHLTQQLSLRGGYRTRFGGASDSWGGQLGVQWRL